MRSLDNWNTYEDTWGKPFQGKFTFCKLGTSELITITNVNGTPLSNPMLSDMYGRTEQQVFLPDIDVTVVMHKWIGPGSMAENDTDDSHWTLVRSFDNLTEVSQITINDQVVEAVRVADKEALQTMVVPDGIEYAILSGYYETGDMPPVNYKLVYNSDLTDNGGSVIQSCGNPDITDAFWVLIPDRVIDCRVFGVFPRNSYNNPTAYTSQLAYCFAYANSMGRDVYMPQVFQNTNNGNTFSYYWLEGITTVLQTRLIIDKNVRICLKTGTSNNITLHNIQHNGESNIFTNNGGSGTLTLDVRGEMCASWFNPSWASFPGSIRKVILDTRSNPFTFRNTIVEVQKLQTNKNFVFEDCYIEADKKFRNCTLNFTRCGFVTDMWLDTGNTVTLVGNQIKLANMTNANTYIEWKNKQNESDYGDLGEQSINASVLAGGTIENCYGSITLQTHGSFEFHNVSLTVNGMSASDSFNAVDSWLTINGATQVANLSIRRGALNGSAVQVLTSLVLENVDMNVPLTTYGARTTIKRSDIQNAIACTAIDIYESSINAAINQIEESGFITGHLVSNRFGVNGRHNISSSTADTVVNVFWIDNHMNYNCLTPELYFIQMNRANFKTADSQHGYIYKDNDPIPMLKITMNVKKGLMPEEFPPGNYLLYDEYYGGNYLYPHYTSDYVDGRLYSQYGLEFTAFHVGIIMDRYSQIEIVPWAIGSCWEDEFVTLKQANKWYEYMRNFVSNAVDYDGTHSTYYVSNIAFKMGSDINSTYRLYYAGRITEYGVPEEKYWHADIANSVWQIGLRVTQV